MWGMVWGTIFLHMDIQLTLLKRLSLLHQIAFALFPGNKLTICIQVYFWTLFCYIDLFVYLHASAVPVSWLLLLYNVLKSNCLHPPIWVFFKIVLAVLCPLQFYMTFRINLSIFTKQKKPSGILIIIALDLYINLERADIVTIMSLPIHKHYILLSWLRYSLNFSAVFCNSQCIYRFCPFLSNLSL